MARPQEQLADALQTLKKLQDDGHVAIRSRDLDRRARERLVAAGYLQPVIKGWYVPARPDERPGDSTAWYASFWTFCASYLESRFNENWVLSPEQSLLLHTGNTTVPRQLLVRSPDASNNITALAHETGILEVRGDLPPEAQNQTLDGQRVYRLPYALINATPRVYINYPTDIRMALGLVRDASELLPALLEGGHSVIAGRLAGALRRIGRERIADDILKAMRAAGYTVTESDPFEDNITVTFAPRERSPYANRIRAYWQSMRDDIIAIFPEAPGLSTDKAAYLKQVDDIYTSDAYHSLSIEGYRVYAELIERVRDGSWNPDQLEEDRKQRDAMAARGYWLAFMEVKNSVERILDGENPGTVTDNDHGDWYRALFTPSVEANLITAADLAGYRNDQVYIRNSMHVPPKNDAVLDCMGALFDHLREEEHAAVRTVLGHWIFVYIHPYMDGNGRMGRFLMNTMLASGGYPWTVITVDRRNEYMAALEQASVNNDIKPFATFLAGSIGKDGGHAVKVKEE
jgi:hypothetical protein